MTDDDPGEIQLFIVPTYLRTPRDRAPIKLA